MGQGVLIVDASRSHSDTPHSIWHLWTSDQPHAQTSTWQHTTFKSDIHAPGRIRTRNPSMRAAAGIGFKNICQTKTRITQNSLHVPLVQPVSCYRFSGRPVSYMLCRSSIFSLLYYRTVCAHAHGENEDSRTLLQFSETFRRPTAHFVCFYVQTRASLIQGYSKWYIYRVIQNDIYRVIQNDIYIWGLFKIIYTGLFKMIYTGLFKMIVGVLTTCHKQYTWDRNIYIFLFNRTTLQVFVTYLTGALYAHSLWFYKHQHDSRVRSKLFVASQRWLSISVLMFVESQRVHI